MASLHLVLSIFKRFFTQVSHHLLIGIYYYHYIGMIAVFVSIDCL